MFIYFINKIKNIVDYNLNQRLASRTKGTELYFAKTIIAWDLHVDAGLRFVKAKAHCAALCSPGVPSDEINMVR